MTPRRAIDYSLYLVTDRDLSFGRPTPAVVSAAVRGGVTCVQLREKALSTRAFLAEARAVAAVLKSTGVPLIINDRIDVALAVRADGVHLGQTDMPIADARPIVGSEMIVGVSVESVEDARTAEAEGADYVSVSPVYATPTKTDTVAPLGVEGVAAVRAAVSVPMVAIGGLNRETCEAIVRAGADGVAVVSAIVSADDPEAAARDLVDRIRRARRP